MFKDGGPVIGVQLENEYMDMWEGRRIPKSVMHI